MTCEACGDELGDSPITISSTDYEYQTCSASCASLLTHYVQEGVETSDEELQDAVDSLDYVGGDE